MSWLTASPAIRHRRLTAAVLAVLTISWCGFVAMRAPLGHDYPGPTCQGCDYAGPPIDALSTGHMGRFFSTQPFTGPVTLLLRAPVVAIAHSLSADELLQYRLGALICLLVGAGLCWLLVAHTGPRGAQWIAAALLVGLVLGGPVTTKALVWGHPEELVGGLLSVVAVVLATRGLPIMAGVALGLALATKQWGWLAVAPTALACSNRRKELLGVAVITATALLLPMLVGDAHRFIAQNLSAGLATRDSSRFPVMPTNIWFPYAHAGATILGPAGGTTYWISTNLASLTHPLVIALGLLLPILYWRLRREEPKEGILLLLALLFLIRCLLDPVTISYHHTPFFIAIAAYELISRRRLPLMSLYTAAGIWALGAWVAPLANAALLNELYLAWALPIAGYLAYRLFANKRQPARQPQPSTPLLAEI